MTQKIILLDQKEIPEIKENFIIINKMKIKDNDNLSIEITFHGGCKEHLFRLLGYFEDDNRLILLLEHNANDDQCKSVLQKELLFDLTSVKNKYNIKNKDNLNNNSLLLKLKNLEARYEISD